MHNAQSGYLVKKYYILIKLYPLLIIKIRATGHRWHLRLFRVLSRDEIQCVSHAHRPYTGAGAYAAAAIDTYF